MTTPVQTIAKYIILNSERISNLKLQKLLYYAQGWRLGLTGDPLFREEIQAWVHGPVVPAVFREYKDFRWQTIAKPTDPIVLPNGEARHIQSVLKAYGSFAAEQLERLSHTEAPWRDARPGLADSEPSTAVISHESMRDFFAAKTQKA